jgi:hypothetical protein
MCPHTSKCFSFRKVRKKRWGVPESTHYHWDRSRSQSTETVLSGLNKQLWWVNKKFRVESSKQFPVDSSQWIYIEVLCFSSAPVESCLHALLVLGLFLARSTINVRRPPSNTVGLVVVGRLVKVDDIISVLLIRWMLSIIYYDTPIQVYL